MICVLAEAEEDTEDDVRIKNQKADYNNYTF